jgi:hypothetical protein
MDFLSFHGPTSIAGYDTAASHNAFYEPLCGTDDQRDSEFFLPRIR